MNIIHHRQLPGASSAGRRSDRLLMMGSNREGRWVGLLGHQGLSSACKVLDGHTVSVTCLLQKDVESIILKVTEHELVC